MDRELNMIATLSDYKKALKTFIKGTIKAGIFLKADTGKAVYTVSKETEGDQKFVEIAICSDGNYAEFAVEVSTRVYNKVDDKLFAGIIDQMNKRKNFAGMEVNF